MPGGCLYPFADVFDPGHLAFVPDVIPSPRLHYYCPRVAVLVPFFWALHWIFERK
jgi:hypothetical protein